MGRFAMNVTPDKLGKLDTTYKGYLEGAKVNEFLDEYGIKFSAGHWCAGEFIDRFCPVGYNSNTGFDNSEEAQIKRVKDAGIRGIEFHEKVFIDDHYAKRPHRVTAIKKALQEAGLVCTVMNMNTWTDPKWKFGGLTNPDPGIRRDCIELCKQGVDIGHEMECPAASLWPGSDGWDYHFESDYGDKLNWYIDGCTAVAERCAQYGMTFGTEPKQKEPREGNMIINTVAKAAIVAQQVNKNLGKTVMGVAIDYGHEQMVGNQPADSLYLLKRIGIPSANFHVNGAKFNSNDEDRIAGTDDVWRLAEFCYAAVDTGYEGWFGEDQFTYRTDQTKSMELSKEFFATCMKKALLIYRRRPDLQKAQSTGDAVQTIEVVKKIILSE
jgi:xylose isomerase